MKKQKTLLLITAALFIAWPGQKVLAQQVKVKPATYVVVKDGTSLTISGNTTIEDGGMLDIYGNTTVSGTLTSANAANVMVRSDADKEGSLIFGSGTAEATIQRYVGVSSPHWHMVSVPLTTGATTANFYFDANPSAWLMRFVESEPTESAWQYVIDIDEALHHGEGFLLMPDNSVTAKFEGTVSGDAFTLNSSSSPALTYNASSGSPGFNLVGNPFTSAIQFDNGGSTDWTMTNMEKSIWVLDQSGGQNNYRNRTSGGGGTLTEGILPKGQAFFVRATAANPVLTIPTSAKLHHSQDFYKSNQEVGSGYEYFVKLRVSQNQSWDEIMVSFGSNGTESFDNGYDCSKMMGDEKAPQLYLVEPLANNTLSINHLPLLSEDRHRVVQMDFIAGTTGEQSFTADLSRLGDQRLVLEDLKENLLHDLSDNNIYSFIGSKEDDPARFKLHFYDVTALDENLSAINNIKVYSFRKEIVLQPLSQQEGSSTLQLQLFDLMGRLLYATELPAGQTSRLNMTQLPDGVVLARVLHTKGVQTTRLLLQD
ncbi:MAG: T9SS type A sorting domain-containing protein [Bacteroidales bacterium]|nr:T9SS type A sorting domain-containing protein [Bacteroidales bacterium]